MLEKDQLKEFKEAKENLMFEISYCIEKYLVIPCISFYERVANIIRWLPVLWKDRDFDHYYTYTILRFKLQNVYNFLTSEDAVAVHPETHLKKLKICINLLDRILNDVYMEIAESEFRPRKEQKDIFEGSQELPDGSILLRSMTEEEKAEFQKWNTHYYYLHNQDYNMLHQIMNKYSVHWWD